MRNSNTILASVQAFMDKMQDGDMRELVANLQAALEYKNEELRIYREKFEAETGKKQPVCDVLMFFCVFKRLNYTRE